MIILQATLDDSLAQKEPFAKPLNGTTLYFHVAHPMTLYKACLVEVRPKPEGTPYDLRQLWFFPVNLSTGNTIETKPYDVDLTDSDAVWSRKPSSEPRMANPADPEKRYIILFLNHRIVDSDAALKSSAPEDGGKWPRSSAIGLLEFVEAEQNKMRNIVRDFREALDQDPILRDKFEQLFAQYLT